ENACVQALLVDHTRPVRLRVSEVVVPLRVLGAGDGREDHSRSKAPGNPPEHTCSRARSSGSNGMARIAQALLPASGVLLLAGREAPVDIAHGCSWLAHGHREILRGAVDLFLAIFEPAFDVTLRTVVHGLRDTTIGSTTRPSCAWIGHVRPPPPHKPWDIGAFEVCRRKL